MWKNFLFFSSSQRAGIIVLFVLILLLWVVRQVWVAQTETATIHYTDSTFVQEWENFKLSLVSIDSLRRLERQSRYHRRDFQHPRTPSVELFPFNPNTIDSTGMVRLGLKPWVASNILKYRQRGGKFRDKNSFAKIYGISKEQFAQLESFIQITTNPITSNRPDTVVSNPVIIAESLPEVLELNSADTAQLIQIRGIGRFLANGIVRFRSQSGGFLHLNQLLDVRGITPEVFANISPHFTVDPTLVRKLRINTASVERLRSHPYLNFYQAKQIYELRRKRGKLHSMQELHQLSELDPQTMEKIAGYFQFE